MRIVTSRSVVASVIGSAALLTVYLGILMLVGDLTHALEQFGLMYFWVVPLSLGFGVQLGLFTVLKAHLKRQAQLSSTAVVASGGVSTGSMVACCAHHLADILPLLGLSAVAVFLTRFQTSFLVLGLVSNVFGIFVVLSLLQRHEFVPEGRLGRALFGISLRRIRNAFGGFGLTVVAAVFTLGVVAPYGNTQESGIARESEQQTVAPLATITDNRNDITVEITPIMYGLSKPWVFEMQFNTHQGDLAFDVETISHLEDDSGRVYKPLRWDGSPPGGHHRSGTLEFPSLDFDTQRVRLILKDVHGLSERVFEWNAQEAGG